jgi:hypothetical protein
MGHAHTTAALNGVDKQTGNVHCVVLSNRVVNGIVMRVNVNGSTVPGILSVMRDYGQEMCRVPSWMTVPVPRDW